MAVGDRVMVEQMPFTIGQQLCLDDVLMVGTLDYTAIGRPQIHKARVYATIEESCQTEKVIYFKLRRRKGYQRNGGHRQTVNVLKIDKIVHDVSESDFSSNAVMLRKPSESANIVTVV